MGALRKKEARPLVQRHSLTLIEHVQTSVQTELRNTVGGVRASSRLIHMVELQYSNTKHLGRIHPSEMRS